MNFRIGFGIDVHPLKAGIPLVIGGVHISSEKGTVGHSDADVLLHAICDALMGALSLGDIGQHFPDNDPTYKNCDSKILLARTFELITSEGYSIGNLDTTVVLEKPKLAPYIAQMRNTIAEILHTDLTNVSVKATTHEKLDSFGEEKAIKAYCTCLVVKN